MCVLFLSWEPCWNIWGKQKSIDNLLASNRCWSGHFCTQIHTNCASETSIWTLIKFLERVSLPDLPKVPPQLSHESKKGSVWKEKSPWLIRESEHHQEMETSWSSRKKEKISWAMEKKFLQIILFPFYSFVLAVKRRVMHSDVLAVAYLFCTLSQHGS